MEDKRTNSQNRGLHKYYRMVSDEAREKGVTVKMMMQKLPDADITITPQIVKEIWRIFQEKELKKESTTELTKKDVDIVLEPFNKFLAENWDIVLPFPSREEQDLIDRVEQHRI